MHGVHFTPVEEGKTNAAIAVCTHRFTEKISGPFSSGRRELLLEEQSSVENICGVRAPAV